MAVFISNSAEETRQIAFNLAQTLSDGDVIAMFGGMGMGKTAFTHGLASGLGIDDRQVSSPTFALVHEYGEKKKLYHFDMYRIESWDDLYSTGFFDYLDSKGILAVEWSENIINALPDGYTKVEFQKGDSENQRIITIGGNEA